MSLNNKIRIHHIPKYTIFIMVSLILCSCDPGIFCKPKGWSENSPLWWTTHFGSVEISMTNMGGFVGDTVTGTEIILKNHSDALSLTIKDIILKTKTTSTTAIFNTESLSPGESRTVRLLWTFREPLYKILIEPIELQIVILFGREEVVLHIPIIRQN